MGYVAVRRKKRTLVTLYYRGKSVIEIFLGYQIPK